MPLTCPLLLLFVLKLENHLSQELEILYRAWAQKISEYLFSCFVFFQWSRALNCVNGHYFVFYLFWQSVLVPVLDNHVSDEQLMSIRNL